MRKGKHPAIHAAMHTHHRSRRRHPLDQVHGIRAARACARGASGPWCPSCLAWTPRPHSTDWAHPFYFTVPSHSSGAQVFDHTESVHGALERLLLVVCALLVAAMVW